LLNAATIYKARGGYLMDNSNSNANSNSNTNSQKLSITIMTIHYSQDVLNL